MLIKQSKKSAFLINSLLYTDISHLKDTVQ